MPPVTHPHSLPVATAIERLHGFTAALERQYEGRVKESSQSWSGPVLTYSIVGIRERKIRGTVTVTEGLVTVEATGDIPRFVEGRVTREIKSALAEALGS